MRKIQSRAYVLIAFLIVWVVTLYRLPTIAGTSQRPNETFAEIPMDIGEWGGEKGTFDDATRQVLTSCDLFLAEYVNKKGEMVQLTIVYGRDLGDFHQPEYCLEGQGWRTIGKRLLTIKEVDDFEHQAVELYQRTSFQDQVVIFWFASEGEAATTLGKHKMSVYFDRLLTRRVKPSALIRFIAPIRTDESSTSDAVMQLARILGPYIRKVLDK